MYKRFNAANVIFLFPSDMDSYKIFATDPYRNHHECGSLKPIIIDECQHGILKNVEETTEWLRTSKVPKTLPDCTFKFCARVSEPYVNERCETGLEIELINVMQDILQFKVKPVFLREIFFFCSDRYLFDSQIDTFCTNLARGEPHGNGSWSELLGMLRNDECDFLVGGFFPDFEVHNDFGVTNSYFQDSYTWYVMDKAYYYHL